MLGEDTETLIALVSSLLDGEIPDQAEILEALADCNGNVDLAAQLLKEKQHSREAISTKKRKRTSRLDDWLNPSAPNGARSPKRPRSPSPIRPSHAGPSSKPLSASTSSSSKVKSLTSEEFMTMLRPSASSGGLSKPSPVKYPPLTLSTPELVAKHTPCTLHTSILPPDLACRLFYVMLHESRSWERNKWYLFDRLVESPHRTSFFIRKSTTEMCDQYDVEMDEAAQYWYNGRKTGPVSSIFLDGQWKRLAAILNES
ncbi:hypothetical protein NLI96_g9964 [Meripilus lineatus]|uniref:CUE domain-containing protein n=1 Tax=Meripilus lineatus TaxID=2056292 RepID=A0AAD5YCF9_9APHY|nr:hypothetical protein NLI96_g9964 [Physisporinus lineatus]